MIDSIKSEAIKSYNNDPAILEFWLKNKSPKIISNQLNDPDVAHFIISKDDIHVGVGSISNNREINRCYIRSSFARQGFGSKLLNYMINEKCKKTGEVITNSSLGAIKFYQKNGFELNGECEMWGPIKMQPMMKRLSLT